MNQRIKHLLSIGLFVTSFAMAQQTLQEDQDFRFAIQLENRGLYDIAALQFERFADTYPTSPQAPTALLQAGENYEKADSLARASRVYLAVLLQYPQSAILDKAQYNQGRLLAKNGEHLQAAIAYDRIKVLSPRSALIPEAQIAAAHSFLLAGDLQRSYDAAFYILENHSTHPARLRAHKTIADVHEHRGDYTLALQSLERILSDRVEDDLAATAYIQKAEILKKLGRFTQADSVLNKLVAGKYASPIVSGAALTLARSMQEQGQFRDAATVLNNALAKVTVDDKSDLWLTLGDNYYLEEDFSQAKSTYLKVANAAQTSSGLYLYRLGMVDKALGDVPSASSHFEQVLDDTTLHEKIRIHAAIEYADLIARSGRAVEGIRYLQNCVATATEQADRNELLLAIAGLQETCLQDFVGARQNYHAILAGSPKSSIADDAQYFAARSYEYEGNLKNALGEYSRYLQYYPGGDFHSISQQKVDIFRLTTPAESKTLQQAVNEIVAPVSRAGALHTLAHYQMHSFYDYARALELLESAERENADGLNLEKVYYDKGFCHFILQGKASLAKRMQEAGEHAGQLMRLAERMATNYPQSKLTDQVEYWAALANLPTQESVAARSEFLTSSINKMNNDSLRQHLQLRLVDEIVASSRGQDASQLEQAGRSLDAIISSSACERIQAEALYKRALLFYHTAKSDSSIALLNRMLLLRDSTRRVDALYLLATLYEERGNDSDAQRLYYEVAEHYFYSPSAARAEVKLISLMLRRGQVKEAEARVLAKEKTGVPRELKIFYPVKADDEALWLWTELTRRTKSPQQAVAALQQYLDLGKDSQHYAEALFAIGELADEMNKQEMALGYFQECAAIVPDEPLGQKARFKTAQLYFDRGLYEEAGERYADIRDDLSGDVRKEAFVQQIICHYRLGKLGRAEDLLKQFKKEYDDRNAEAKFLYEEGMFYINSKDFAKAEKSLKTLASRYDDVPQGARGDLGLARLYVVQTKTEEALKRLTEIPTKYKDPEIVATAFLNLADFYYENRALANTVEAGKQVLQLTNDRLMRGQALDLLINALDDLGMRDQAIAYQREYIETYPHASDLLDRRIRIGTFLYYLKEYDRAIVQLKELKPLAPANDEARVQFWIAESYAAAGLTEQAIIEYLKVRYQCQQHPKLPFGVTALYKAGEGYQKLGNLPKAKEMYETVVRERGATDDIGRHASRKLQEVEAEMGKQL
ncbi:tetratricopeptide repeat protein [candidate division KSB1 bacterium]|nr:tetratricopeptide repeat protein [candidate division KSB1 bacterium]